MVGGMITATILTLMVSPAIDLSWRRGLIARRPGAAVCEALHDSMALGSTD